MARLFIGIPVKKSFEILQAQNILKKKLPSSHIAWVPPENFHITLKFLGEVEDFFINAIKLSLHQIAGQSGPFYLEPSGPGYFGPGRNPKVIWYGYKPSDMITRLAAAINDGMLQLGIPKEEKPFRSHVTLGRVKKLVEINAFSQYMKNIPPSEEDPVYIDSFSLVRSRLRPEGPRYTEIEKFKLAEKVD